MAIKPATSVEAVVKYADFVDTLLIMTVEPGFGGQKFMHDMMPKVSDYIVVIVSVYIKKVRCLLMSCISPFQGFDVPTRKVARFLCMRAI